MYGTYLSPRFDTLNDLLPWIGEQQYIQMDFWQFSRNADICVIAGKLSEIHLDAWLLSNPQEKVLVVVGISCSPDLRVQHMNFQTKQRREKKYVCQELTQFSAKLLVSSYNILGLNFTDNLGGLVVIIFFLISLSVILQFKHLYTVLTFFELFPSKVLA